jgi:hypothetical protein
VTVWFTGSACANGNLAFPAAATVADKNRFWAVVAAAKLTQTRMFVWYDNTPATGCAIGSFGIDAQ